MGILKTPPPQPEPAPSSPTDPSHWLDNLLANLATTPPPQPPAETARQLAATPIEAIISAVERAGPKPSHTAAIALYHHWITHNPSAPTLWAAYFNLGAMHQQNTQTTEAAAAYNQAIQLRPDMPCTAINLGLLQENSGQPELALATWRRATQPDDARVALQIQQGRLLEKIGRLADAEQMLRRVLLTDPAQPDVIHHWIHLRQKTCLWPAIPTDIPGLPPPTLTEHAGPLGLLALTDDIDTQIRAGQNWVARKTIPAPEQLAPPHPYSHPRIRIGYLSSDFCSHAMSYLIAELFERQDRSRFELYGYCASREDGSDIRRRVLAAFNHRRFIAALTDEQAARLIRADEIDILIDLNGITEGSRLALLRWRPAPIQATYLGFIGPVPLPELDYLLCDNLVIPPEHAPRYQPTPLPIGPTYQANDSKRTTGPQLTRAQAGLPEQKFIFTCVSKHYKITEQLFAAWMTILHQVENAVLWLIKDNPYSEANLIAEARRANIAPERLIISDRADPDIYLSRLGLADLFLDTFPYNAGTVASDAIRMQLPLITLCGTSFASRMATSLLNAIGATQGITTSLPKYIATAVHLAQNPQAYAAFKTHFTAQRWNQTIGNIERFTTAFDNTLHHLATTHKPPAPTAADHVAKALAHHQAGHLREAAAAYRAALELEPHHANALLNLGSIHLALAETEAGEKIFRQLTQMDPANATAHGNLAKSLHDLNRIPEAFESYRAALTLAPTNPDILMNFGAALMEAKCWADAITVTQHALAIRPNNAMAHTNLATALYNTGRLNESLQSCQAAMALNPEHAIINATLGGLLLELGQLAAAKTLCERALTADPNLPNAHFNLSHALKGMNNLPAAIQTARHAIALSPESATYHFHLAHTLLLNGDLNEGWEEYEWRWRLPNFAWAQTVPALLSKPRWQGEDIGPETLLIFAEQGLGDIVQFARYIPLAATRAAHTIIAAQPHLHALLKSIPGIEIVSITQPLPAFHSQCPLMSLPRALQTNTIPSAVPYLHAPPNAKTAWHTRMKSKNLRVGIVWAGNPDTQRDRFRSPRLASVAPLFAIPGIDFYALQLGPGRADIAATPLPPHVTDLGPEITNLTDTAAIMANLDLMISSCTGPLHLAGALAVPTWAILPFAPHFCWRLDSAQTPWYPTMQLYRQDEYGEDWSGVVSRIATHLAARAKTKAPAPPATPQPRRRKPALSHTADPTAATRP